MLMLTRKANESIRIGRDILVKVFHTGRGSVKIGVDAPQHVRVVRGELNLLPFDSSLTPGCALPYRGTVT